MTELRARRARGEIAADAKVSTAQMARVAREIGAPVSEATFRRLEQIALVKIRLAILAIIESHPAAADLINPEN